MDFVEGRDAGAEADEVIICITTITPPVLFERGLKRLYQILPRFLALPLFLDGLWVVKMISCAGSGGGFIGSRRRCGSPAIS
jgi:hypothetical protein